MQLDELTRIRARQSETVREWVEPRVRSKQIADDLEAFLKSGNQIVKIETGKCTEFGDAGMPIDAAKRQIAINNRIARSNAKSPGRPKLTDNCFIGSICNVCRTNVRFLSNAECKACNEAKRKEAKQV